MQKPTVLFINRVYPPAKGATGRVLRDLAHGFARDGWDVTVLTADAVSDTSMDGVVKVIRVATHSGKTPRRYAMVWAKLLWTALRLPRHQMVVTLTDPPMLVVAGRIIAKWKKSTHIHWCQDLYPDILPALGMNIPDWAMNILRKMAQRAIASCDRVVVIGRCMARHMAQNGVDMRKVSIIPNWPDFELTPAGRAKIQKLKQKADHVVAEKAKPTLNGREHLKSRPFFLDDAPKFRVLYSGNLGRAHPVATILDAAQCLMVTNPEIEFVFVGDGDGFDTIARERAQRGLDNIRLLPPQPVSRLKDLMEGGDVHLISMKHEVSGLLVPSKLYAALAAGRPCIFIGPDSSETAKVIKEYGAGSIIAQGDAQKLAAAILKYRNDGDVWFAAQNGAVRAGEKYIPANSISSWIKGARDTIRSRVA